MGQKCATKHCRNEKKPTESICYCCTQARWKQNSPFAYHYNALRNNARRRGKDISLTLDQYTEFAKANGLFAPDGTKRKNRTIDRIDPARGYHLDNIQVLTTSENSRKRYVDHWRAQAENLDAEEFQKWREYEQRLQAEIDARTAQEQQLEDAPF